MKINNLFISSKEPDKDCDSYVQLVKARIKLGDIPQASKEVQMLIETYPDNLDIQLLQADIERVSGNQEKALSLYENLVQVRYTL